MSISSASLSDRNTKKKQPKEIKFRNDKLRSDTPSVSCMSVHGASITTVLPYKERKKSSENFIKGKESIQ